MKDGTCGGGKEIVCIVCPNGCRIRCVPTDNGYLFTGNRCPRGKAYAESELTRPMRTLTTSVRTSFSDAPVVSVRTDGEIEKKRIPDALSDLSKIVVTTRVGIGDVIVKDLCGTGVNVICTTNRLKE